MLDSARILTDEVFGKTLHHFGCRFLIGPSPGLAEAVQPVIRLDADVENPIDLNGANSSNRGHRASYVIGSGMRTRCARTADWSLMVATTSHAVRGIWWTSTVLSEEKGSHERQEDQHHRAAEAGGDLEEGHQFQSTGGGQDRNVSGSSHVSHPESTTDR